MITFAAALFASQAPTAIDMTLTAASLFKNGYSVVTREAQVTKSGYYELTGFPTSSIGTLWVTGSRGITIQELVNAKVEREQDWTAASIDDMLAASVGKEVGMRLAPEESVFGTLLAVNGSIVIVETRDKTISFPKNRILSLTTTGEVQWRKKVKSQQTSIRMKVSADAPGTLTVTSLEFGLMWLPSYTVDISDEKRLRITAKATVLNDLADFEGAELQLITGFPNLPYIGIRDPLNSGEAVSQVVAHLTGGLTRPDPRRRDASGLAQMTSNRLALDRGGMDDAFLQTGDAAGREEDLFFYKQPNVTLKAGERGHFVLFRNESDYSHIYTWDVAEAPGTGQRITPPPSQEQEVWHSLRFNNSGTMPYTTGVAVTTKKGNLLGQDMLYYTAAGAEATVRITKALDIRTEAQDEEIDRVRNALMTRNVPTHDLVTVKTTLTMHNRKQEDVKVRVSKLLLGEVTASEGSPKVTKTAKGLSDVNPGAKVVWERDLKAGEQVTLTVTYKAYIPQ